MHGGNFGILFVLGISVFGGMLGAWFFQRLKIPQVVGYISIGLLIGQSGLGWVKPEDIVALRPFNIFALGIIGFLVGGEILIGTLKQYAKQFTAILLGEGLLSFGLVGLSSGLILWRVTGSGTAAIAAGVVLGAIASATDPASTIDVLWEYRARGMLTTAITAIVALDDALAMTLYGIGTGVANLLAGGETRLLDQLGKLAVTLGGAVAVGAALALLMNLFLRWVNKPERSLSLTVGLLLLAISAATFTGMDVILLTMTLGFTLANLAPRRSRPLFETMRSFSVPIYVLFFVLVGARLGLKSMPGWLWGVVLAYVFFRSAGKIAGAWAAARWTKSDLVLQRYLGVGLFAQGGVAVGLSIVASQYLNHIRITADLSLGNTVIFTVTATTLIVQILGPPLVKWAVKRSGEAGRNIREEDVIELLHVRDVMETGIEPVQERERLRDVVPRFTEGEHLVFPVVNREGRYAGLLSLADLREVLMDQEAWDWLLAADVMAQAEDKAYADAPLKETMARMQDLQIEEMPVLAAQDDLHPVGLISLPGIRRRVASELLRRQQMHTA